MYTGVYIYITLLNISSLVWNTHRTHTAKSRLHTIIRARTMYSCMYSIYRILENSIPRLRLLCSVPRYSTILSRELNFHPLRSRCQRSGRISRAQSFPLARQPIADYYLVVDRSRTNPPLPPPYLSAFRA